MSCSCLCLSPRKKAATKPTIKAEQEKLHWETFKGRLVETALMVQVLSSGVVIHVVNSATWGFLKWSSLPFSWTLKHCIYIIYAVGGLLSKLTRQKVWNNRTNARTTAVHCVRRNRWSPSELWPSGLDRNWKCVVSVDNAVYPSNMLCRL